ncbi:MAG: bifunctional serine/threonine-protein kinase/ABC transporter substrate-binding protein [bacterium]|nr:bifunctional serine/threonine-protein kinase/ABC transporter substrate-binding protein [bacterium]
MSTSDKQAYRHLGDFILEARIGRGGMANVYRAVQVSTRRPVALKVFEAADALGDAEEFELRFAQEARLIASLEHLHIVPIYDYGLLPDGNPYIAMRLMPESLHDALRSGSFTVERALHIYDQIADALHFAHKRGIIHRDIKPSNVLLDETGNAYITDFGLAKVLEASLNLTKSGVIVGAPAFASPEQLTGLPTDARSDVYSLGVLLVHMLTGHSPFGAERISFDQLVQLQLRGEPPTLPESLVPAPQRRVLQAVIRRAMAQRPDDRYADIQAMADALHPVRQTSAPLPSGSAPVATLETPIVRAEPSALPQPIRRLSASRHQVRRFLFSAGAISVLVAGILLTAILLSRRAPAPIILTGERWPYTALLPAGSAQGLAWGNAPHQFVGYFACTLDIQHLAILARLTTMHLADQGIHTRLYNANLQPDEQQRQIEAAVEQGMSAAIVCPVYQDAAEASLNDVRARAIPYVLTTAIAGDTSGVVIDTHPADRGFAIGQAAGAAFDLLPEGEARILILLMPELLDARYRAEGIRAALAQMPSISSDQIIADRPVDPAGVDEMLRPLIAVSDVPYIVITTHDALAVAVIAWLENAAVPVDQVQVFSLDHEPPADAWIREGRYLKRSFPLPIENTAEVTAWAVLRLLRGETLPQFVDVPFDSGLYQAP